MKYKEGTIMKRIILFFAALSAVSVSCNKENPELNNAAQAGAEVKIYATAPGVELPATPNQVSPKSVLGADGFSVLWEDGDQILCAAMPSSYYAGQGTVQATSVFTTSLTETSGAAFFLGTNPHTNKHNMYGSVFYPATVNYTATSTESITYNLANEQVAGPNGSFGRGYNFAGAFVRLDQLKEGAPQTITFRNVCACIRFVLPSSVSDVKSVTVSSSDAVLSGNAKISKEESTDRYGYKTDFNFHFASSLDNVKEVTLNNGGASFVPGVEYNIIVWPGTHSNLTFTFTNAAGLKCVKNVGKQVVLVENEVDRFNFKSAFEFTDVATLEVNKENISLTSSASSSSFTVSANNAWTATSNQSWLTVSPASGSASNSATVNVSASANTTSSSRTATVTIKSSDLTKTITVTQPAMTYKVNGSAVQNAADLKNGGLYVICRDGSNYYMTVTESTSALSMTTHYTSDTFYSVNVFEYNYDGSKVQTFDSNYRSNSGGILKSVSTEKYMSYNFYMNISDKSSSSAQYLSIANRWGSDGPGVMDVYRAGMDNSMGYTTYFFFANNGSFSSVNQRKWIFYEVSLQ